MTAAESRRERVHATGAALRDALAAVVDSDDDLDRIWGLMDARDDAMHQLGLWTTHPHDVTDASIEDTVATGDEAGEWLTTRPPDTGDGPNEPGTGGRWREAWDIRMRLMDEITAVDGLTDAYAARIRGTVHELACAYIRVGRDSEAREVERLLAARRGT